jgi:spoIIIJ-associated protein
VTSSEGDAGRSASAQPHDEPAARAAAVVERVLESLGVGGEVAVEETPLEICVSISGENDSALLIGRHGMTIDALQHIAARAAFHGHDRDRKRVVVDAAGYRDRRQSALERAAEQAAEDALAGGRPVELDPMNAFERRIVHEHLKDRAGLETHSEGEEPDRRLVVSPLPGASGATEA